MKHWFTLIELLIVMVVIAILATVTLKLNRSQIWETSAMNERENRLMRHDKHTTIATNTNYISWQKIEEIYFSYDATGVNLEYLDHHERFYFTHNIFSGQNFTITKSTLELGCTVQDNDNHTMTLLYWANKSKNFILDEHLCTWKTL